MGISLGWHVDKICLYPYGGVTKFDEDINRSIREEFLILISGPLFQSIYLLLGKHIFTDGAFIDYHLAILFFNLLPLYPLDGGRILNLFFNHFLSFRSSYYISIVTTFIMSFFFIVTSLDEKYSLNVIIMFLIVIGKTFEEYKKRNYYFNKFLLERHINDYHFTKLKMISSLKKMMRDRRHIIVKNGSYRTEKECLNDLYKSN